MEMETNANANGGGLDSVDFITTELKRLGTLKLIFQSGLKWYLVQLRHTWGRKEFLVLERVERKQILVRLRFSFIIIEHYVRGWSTASPEKAGNFDTLRIVSCGSLLWYSCGWLHHTSTASQWNDGILRVTDPRIFDHWFHTSYRGCEWYLCCCNSSWNQGCDKKGTGGLEWKRLCL